MQGWPHLWITLGLAYELIFEEIRSQYKHMKSLSKILLLLITMFFSSWSCLLADAGKELENSQKKKPKANNKSIPVKEKKPDPLNAKVNETTPQKSPFKKSELAKENPSISEKTSNPKPVPQKKPISPKINTSPIIKGIDPKPKPVQKTPPPQKNSDKNENKIAAKPKESAKSNPLPVVAEVNGQPIHTYAFEKLLIEQLQAGIADSVELRKKIRDELVIQTLLGQLAMEEGVDQSKEVELAFESARRGILADAWRQNWVRENPVSENDIMVEYNASIQKLGEKEYQLRQVVVADETAAMLILDQLDTGKELGDLATRYTIEAGGKKSKGLLPWVSPSLLLSPLGDLVSQSKSGDLIKSPVRTKAGWHIVRVEGVRPLKPPTLEQLRNQIAQGILQQRMTQNIQNLLNQAKINF